VPSVDREERSHPAATMHCVLLSAVALVAVACFSTPTTLLHISAHQPGTLDDETACVRSPMSGTTVCRESFYLFI